MKYISSVHNPQIKTLIALQDKARKRAQNNQFIIKEIKEDGTVSTFLGKAYQRGSFDGTVAVV